jgi:HEPN domain-containing protein
MIEEILSSIFKVAEMKKTQTHIRSAVYQTRRPCFGVLISSCLRLRNGHSIHFVSALLLELLQSCAYNVEGDIDDIRRKANLRSMTSAHNDEASGEPNEAEEHVICKRTVELIEKSAFAIVNFLLKKLVLRLSIA